MFVDNEKLLSQLYEYEITKPEEYISIHKYLIKEAENLSNDFLRTGLARFPKNPVLKKYAAGFAVGRDDKISERKVFCIGLSGTGTNSLSDALKFVGLSGRHWNGDDGKHILDWDEIDKYEFLSDTPISFIFESLFYAYPKAHFIYTTREKSSWSKSMNNHFKWAGGFSGFCDFVTRKTQSKNPIISLPLWSIIHRNLYSNHKDWVDAYDKFDQRVKRFFSGKADSKFLQLDLAESDRDKWTKISEFIKLDYIPIRPFPRKNIKLNEFKDRGVPSEIDKVIRYNEDQSGAEALLASSELVVMSHEEFVINKYNPESNLELKFPLKNSNYYTFSRSNGVRKPWEILHIKNAYLSIDFSKPYSIKYYIFDSNRRYIPTISFGEEPFISDDVRAVAAKVGFLEDKFSKFNVCHLLLDKIPRYYDFADCDLEKIILFNRNNYVNCLSEFLGLDFLDFEGESKRVTLLITDLYCSSSSSYSFVHPGNNIYVNTKNFVSNLKSKLNVANPVSGRKLYINRSKSAVRNIVNSKEVEELLFINGFEQVFLEEMTLAEQVEIFASAEKVVGVHGAGLTNICFSKPGTIVIEIIPPLCATNAFWKLANAFDLEYRCIIANDPENIKPDYTSWVHNPAKYNRRDVIVDLVELEVVLNA